MPIRALEAADARAFTVEVAGPAGLLVAKLYKMAERVAEQRRPDRVQDKDAGDIYRLMQAIDVAQMGRRLLSSAQASVSANATRAALGHLEALFSRRGAIGVVMAARSVGAGGVPADTVAAVCTAYTGALLRSLEAVR